MPSNCIHKLTFTHSLNDYGMTGYVVTRSVRMYNTQNHCNVVALMLLCNSHSERSHHNKGCVPSDKIVTKKFLYSFHCCSASRWAMGKHKANPTPLLSHQTITFTTNNSTTRCDTIWLDQAPQNIHSEWKSTYIYFFLSIFPM